MKTRCLNKNTPAYENYGGRGIKVCDRWLNSFENFLADMGNRPDGLMLERMNNDGNYEPSNCKWGTRLEQNNNTRKTIRIEFDGKTMTLRDWSEKTGICKETLASRFYAGWSVSEILNKPVQQNRPTA